MVDVFQSKRYDVNLIYTGSYDSISPNEIKRDPFKKVVFELAKRVSQCLKQDFGSERVYYPDLDMLGGVNFFDEFDRVIEGSFVTLLIVSKDIKENGWFKWLNHSAVKREKDNIGLNTIFLAAPGMGRELIKECNCEFMLVESVIFVEKEPISLDEIFASSWYGKIKRSISTFSGRTTANRQISERAQTPGAMASRPNLSIQESRSSDIRSEEEQTTETRDSNETQGQNHQNFHAPRGDILTAGSANLRASEEVTDPPPEGIERVLPRTKEGKQIRTTPPHPAPGPQPRTEDSSRPAPGRQPRIEDSSRPAPGPQPRTEDSSRPEPGRQPRTEDSSRPAPGPQPRIEDSSRPAPGPQHRTEDSSRPAPGRQARKEDISRPDPGRQPRTATWSIDSRKVIVAIAVVFVVGLVWRRKQ